MRVREGCSIDLISIKFIKRLLIITLIWSAIYLLPYNVSCMYQYGLLGPIKCAYWMLLSVVSNPILVLFQGTKGHLWFLPSLIYAMALTYIFVKYDMSRTLIIVAITLYVIGLLGRTYSHTPIGININFNTRNGPFFGTIFFVSGYLVSRFHPQCRWLFIGTCVLAIGIIIHFTEAYCIWCIYGMYPWYDYFVGTYFMGVGAALMALSNHCVLSNSMLANIGKLALGIYVAHYMFIDILNPVRDALRNPLWEICYPIIVLVGSVALISFLLKCKYTRSIVQ
jgi:hypothetical protein